MEGFVATRCAWLIAGGVVFHCSESLPYARPIFPLNVRTRPIELFPIAGEVRIAAVARFAALITMAFVDHITAGRSVIAAIVVRIAARRAGLRAMLP